MINKMISSAGKLTSPWHSDSPAIGKTHDAFAADLRERLSRSHLPALDGLRAVAVFLVIFYHFGFLHMPGGHGVMLFFALSGFLITWLLLEESSRTGRVSLSGFYRRRILRIFPAFYGYWLLLVVLLLVTGHKVLWGHAFSSFFYLTNYYNAAFGDPNTGFSHTWSLSIEEQFYLLWPAIFIRLQHDLKKMTMVLSALIAAVWMHRFILYFGFSARQEWFYASFDTRLDNLLDGCLLAVLLKREVLSRFWRAISARMWLPLVTVSLLLLSIYGGNRLMPRYRDVFGLAIDPLLFAVFLVQMISLCASPLWQWLEWPVVRWLGRISYSLYLYQQLTLYSVTRRVSSQPVIVQLLLAVAVTVLASAISYYLIERPFLKLKRGNIPRLHAVSA